MHVLLLQCIKFKHGFDSLAAPRAEQNRRPQFWRYVARTKSPFAWPAVPVSPSPCSSITLHPVCVCDAAACPILSCPRCAVECRPDQVMLL